MTEPSRPASEDLPDPATDGTTDEDAPPARKSPVWWLAVPALVAGNAGYRLLQGDTGGIWPWGEVVMLVIALALLAFVLADRRRVRR
ncbi:hypothetical protein [Modestobacter sp. Leaf380]|uniref:hypothetical protein n=1 Tax=Modestobacter sp. Leaf380 TaxID=1736356 RepID=UPI0006F6F7D0|nr:hypothetical protein [Modestobacter sp. Leaf380]KQS73685.1 hypothetical protein ASG41_03520 [Modestobacter sp. Leaf380]